jgi:hypothetical protein
MKQHAMKTRCEWRYRFIVLRDGTVGDDRSASSTGRFTPGTHWIRVWVSPTAGLDDAERGKVLALVGNRTPARVIFAAWSLYRLSCLRSTPRSWDLPDIPQVVQSQNAKVHKSNGCLTGGRILSFCWLLGAARREKSMTDCHVTVNLMSVLTALLQNRGYTSA